LKIFDPHIKRDWNQTDWVARVHGTEEGSFLPNAVIAAMMPTEKGGFFLILEMTCCCQDRQIANNANTLEVLK
jgi:hypothetical protein